jgi:hypothetical protein
MEMIRNNRIGIIFVQAKPPGHISFKYLSLAQTQSLPLYVSRLYITYLKQLLH